MATRSENSILLCCFKIPTTTTTTTTTTTNILILSQIITTLSCLMCYCSCSANEFTVSSYSYPRTEVQPYDLRYIRVDLPPWFSSVSIVVESDVDLDAKRISNVPKSTLPLICFRDGSPPLPDVLNTSVVESAPLTNSSFERIQGLQDVQCYPMQRTLTLKLTNEQISPGVWYLGLLNGIGAKRAQSKMIVRSPSYSFTANVSVEGCAISSMWGQYCNQTIDPLSCFQSDVNLITTEENVISCKSFGISCLGEGEVKLYSLDIVEIAANLTIIAGNVTVLTGNGSFTKILSDNAINANGTKLMCFARLGAMPSMTKHDYSSDISKAPLTIPSPRIGRWFISIVPNNLLKEAGANQNSSVQVCYSINWQVLECPMGKAGPDCKSESYLLQTVLRRDSSPFESYYFPVSGNVSKDSANFPLELLFSNSSNGEDLDKSWIYFQLNIPRGAAGGNIHVRLTSEAKVNYEIYARFAGLPTLDSWDYFYANSTRSSDGSSMFFILSSSSEDKIDFYILYVKEGTWTFGLSLLNTTRSSSDDQTIMSVSVERCPSKCSSHGSCKAALDASGLTSYSFCSCDRTHGGFDCSVEIVSHRGHIWQSIALIGSNAAAVLPAVWALRKKAFAEWVLFTSSGISSGLYHACDVGAWCALSFSVLQFLDFWLSFMAVVSTFVYLATIDEALKRAIHTVVAIITALLAVTKATRSSNIVLVITIGAVGLFIGWLVELSTKFRSFSFSRELTFNMIIRWRTVGRWLDNLIKTLLRRFRWVFLLVGFTTLAMAAISWKLESSESYWIWHSLWHITIYSSSFFFLCSKVDAIVCENPRPENGPYELTRQSSFPRTVS